MSTCQEMGPLLAGSAAGVLEPGEERLLREHVRTCAQCAAALLEWAELSASFSRLPVPPPPVGLTERTQLLLAAEVAARADRLQGAILAGTVAVGGWMLAACLLYLWSLFYADVAWVWLAWMALPPMVAVPLAAALRRSLQRRVA